MNQHSTHLWKQLILLLALCLGSLSSIAQPARPSGSEVDKLIQEKLNKAYQQRGQTNRVVLPSRRAATNLRTPTSTVNKTATNATPANVQNTRSAPPAPPSIPRNTRTAPATATSATPAAATNVPATPGNNQPTAPVAGQVAKTTAAGVSIPDPDTVLAPGFLNFKNMDLEQVLDTYSDLVQKTILKAGTLPATQITIQAKGKLTKLEGVQALDTILAMNKIVVIPFGEKFVKIVTDAEMNNQGAEFLSVPHTDLPEADQFVTQIVQLKHALASEVAGVIAPFGKNPQGVLPIESTNVLVIMDFASNVKRMMELIEKIDVEIIRDEDLEVIPIKYALSSDIASVLGSLTEGGVTTTGSSRSGGLSGGSSSRLGSSRTGSSSLNRGSTTGRTSTTQNRTTPQQTASSSRSTFNNRLQQIVQRAAQGGSGNDGPLLGQAQIIADERTNALLVFGTKRERDKVKEIVGKLDTVQPQVLIEAMILEVSLNSNFSFGVDAQQNRNKFSETFSGLGGFNNSGLVNSITTNGLPSGFSYLGALGDSWEIAMRAAEGDGSVNVLSRPRIQTTHAIEASLRIGETVPFVTGTLAGINGNSSQFQNEFVGIELNVLPLINQDGLVVLEITQDVAEVGDSVEIDGNQVPTTLERSAAASVAVQDGETVILGGFISTTRRESSSGVPGLSKIPLLGHLFKSKSDDERKRELIVLIRPTVLPNPSDAALFAKQEKENMTSVTRAELEVMRDDAKTHAINRKVIREFKETEAKELEELLKKQKENAAFDARVEAIKAKARAADLK